MLPKYKIHLSVYNKDCLIWRCEVFVSYYFKQKLYSFSPQCPYAVSKAWNTTSPTCITQKCWNECLICEIVPVCWGNLATHWPSDWPTQRPTNQPANQPPTPKSLCLPQIINQSIARATSWLDENVQIIILVLWQYYSNVKIIFWHCVGTEVGSWWFDPWNKVVGG